MDTNEREIYEILRSKAKLALEEGEKETSLNYLLDAYELFQEGDLAFEIFSSYISLGDYETALDWLVLLYESNKNIFEYYVYFILISNFVSLPTNISLELMHVTDEDWKKLFVSRSDVRFNNSYYMNKARETIYKYDYKTAFGWMIGLNKSLLSEEKTLSVEEYVVFKMLSDKTNKQVRKIKSSIKNEDFNETYKILSIITYPTDEELILFDLVVKMFDTINGIILSKKGDATNLKEAIDNNDFESISKYTDNICIKILAEKLIIRRQYNIENNYKGDLGLSFYSMADTVVTYYKEKKDEFLINEVATYLQNINRNEYITFVTKLIEVYKASSFDFLEIVDVLADIASINPKIDIEHIKHIFGRLLIAKNYKLCDTLIEALESLNTVDFSNTIAYLRHLINYQKYVDYGCTYDGLEEDLETYNKVDEAYNDIMQNRNILSIEAKNSIEEKKIRNRINYYYNLGYIRLCNDDGSFTFYLKKQNKGVDFDRNDFIYRAKFYLRVHNYTSAINLLKHGLTMVKRFDYSMLSLLAYAYQKTNNEDELNRVIKVLKDVCEIDDYEEVLNGEELYLIDVNANYFYGIKDIELIIHEFINVDSSFDSIIKKYNISDDDLPFVYALASRELYKVRDFELGDFFYNMAKNCESEDKELIRFLKEIKANKSYYPSKLNESFTDLVKRLCNNTGE